ncbi:MAG: hypothetical protein JWN45_3028 [Acidobacteriaceae bacterium]|nr:hypothetical protein [Acidobacteriaceae bacterium]
MDGEALSTPDNLGRFIEALPFKKLSKNQAFACGNGILLFLFSASALFAPLGHNDGQAKIGIVVCFIVYVFWTTATNRD